MRRLLIVLGACLLIQMLGVIAPAQDKLSGRWEGKLQSMQGERPTTAIFKKDGDSYTGRTLGLRPGTEIQLKEIKIDGDNITARADIETPQATLVVNYTFKLDGESMKGQGALDFGGQAVTFDIELKRVSMDTEGPLAPAAAQNQPGQQQGQQQGQQGRPQGQRVQVEQPQQKQSIDYFVGQWSFKYLGRESALGPAPREGILTYTKRPDGKTLDGVITGNSESGAYKETSVIVYDEATKTMTFAEKLANGLTVTSRGDWSSPISIRFAVDPVKTRAQSVQLRRIISIISAHSFSVTEELSEDGGPFVRLGSAVYSKK